MSTVNILIKKIIIEICESIQAGDEVIWEALPRELRWVWTSNNITQQKWSIGLNKIKALDVKDPRTSTDSSPTIPAVANRSATDLRSSPDAACSSIHRA